MGGYVSHEPELNFRVSTDSQRRKLFYPDDFESFWKLYAPSKTASKADALKAYQQTRHTRPPDHLLLEAVEAYAASVVTERSIKCHPATFLRGKRWEGFLEEAERRLAYKDAIRASQKAAEADPNSSWAGTPKARLMAQAGITAVVFEAWFRPQTFTLGPPPEIRCSKPLHRSWLMNHYRPQIDRAFGENTRIVMA